MKKMKTTQTKNNPLKGYKKKTKHDMIIEKRLKQTPNPTTTKYQKRSHSSPNAIKQETNHYSEDPKKPLATKKLHCPSRKT
jgi:hypothetical protein